MFACAWKTHQQGVESKWIVVTWNMEMEERKLGKNIDTYTCNQVLKAWMQVSKLAWLVLACNRVLETQLQVSIMIANAGLV